MNIDSDLLSHTAFEILKADLTAHGNVLSDLHRAALLELVDTMSGYVTGRKEGRKAFPLPTGTGKTSAVVAFLAALHRLGYMVPVSVAASQVEALCTMKRDLVSHGVPESLIGLKHSTPDASEASTGNESRLFQLCTHARVRGGRDFGLFGEHEGNLRPLCIYDETLLRCDAFALGAQPIFIALAALEAAAAADATSPLTGHLVRYLRDSVARIREALATLRAEGDPHANGLPVALDPLEPGVLEELQGHLARIGRTLKGFEADLQGLLTMSAGTLRVVGSDQGDGVVTAREVVPPALRNVLVLDASAPIRELAKLDPTITVVNSFEGLPLKRFDQVQVHQLLSPGGRYSVSTSLSADRREASALGQEVASIIKAGWGTETAFLVFTFARRGALDPTAELKRDLSRQGVDLDAKTPEGRPRLEFLTWGQETSRNGLEHCTSVIMAGVLHRSHLDLSAVVRGQTGNPAEPTPGHLIRALVESEIAHSVYQGASRGSCRRITNGQAHPMRLWFVHRDPGMRAILDRVMLGAQWSYPEPKFLVRAAQDTKAARLLGDILGHLKGLPEETLRASSRALKAAMGLGKDVATERAWTKAVGMLTLEAHGWVLDGRSVVRAGAAFGADSLD